MELRKWSRKKKKELDKLFEEMEDCRYLRKKYFWDEKYKDRLRERNIISYCYDDKNFSLYMR